MHRILSAVALGALAIGQVAEPQPVPPATATILWDAVTTNEDGTACDDLDHYEVAVSDPSQDLRAGGVAIRTVQTTETQQPLSDLAESLRGNQRIWVRAVDEAGNAGPWSSPLLVNIDSVSPGTPVNIRVQVNVNVTVNG